MKGMVLSLKHAQWEHIMHGKVERKIRHVQESFMKTIDRSRLSMIQWETLGHQVANSVNNLPNA